MHPKNMTVSIDDVLFQLVNSAHYGIPHKRERVIIVGIRSDLDVKWSFPRKTHSLDSLLWSQYITDDTLAPTCKSILAYKCRSIKFSN